MPRSSSAASAWSRTRYGVDDEICTGDHSCIRLSGCPSLTVKPSPDPLRTDPVATVIESCVGCGLCGEVAHAAVLCPSFYRAEIVRNATWRDRALHRVRQTVIGWLGGYGGEGGGMRSPRPITLLIAALGGEGGGVLTDWIVSAAAQRGFPVQSTSIPGVAQRTGATTYYIEILPVQARRAWRQASGAGAHARRRRHRHRGGERIAGGRPRDRERLRHARPHAVIASLSRFYAMDEKIAMGDGRFDQDRLIKVIRENCERRPAVRHGRAGKAERRDHQCGDARRHRRLRPAADQPEQFEAAIREDGKAVESNLRGFRAGFEAARANLPPAKATDKKRRAAATPAMVEHEVARTFPAVAQTTGLEGVRRLIAYQNVPYAWLYLGRLRPIVEADQVAARRANCSRKPRGISRCACRMRM